ncbi:MAG: AraC family transcriptional regulator [Planctomycetota bacterium]|jgi:AraC-like DNA-binding protein
MPAPVTTIPHSSDPLAEILQRLRLSGTLYCQSELTAPWNIDLPELDDCMMFHIVTAGSCYLQVEGEEPILLESGSLALVPHGQGHLAFSDPDCPPVDLFALPIRKISSRYETLNHGGNGPATSLLCGVVRFDHVAATQLIAQLPKVLAVDAWEDGGDSWLHSTLRFLTREAQELRPGSETVMTRLADILVIQMLRAWIDKTPNRDCGWLVALRDKQIGQALLAIHRQPGHAWTLEGLARCAQMSRSAFSARFSELVGEPAMRYLTRWRMQSARIYLREGTETLANLSRECGYHSEAAFCRAFKRMFGVSPGAMRASARSNQET